MTRAALRIYVARAAGLLLAALAAAGCSHVVSDAATRRALDALPPRPVLRAYVYHNNLILVVPQDGKKAVFRAEWKANVLEQGQEVRFRTTRLKLVEKAPKGVEQMHASVREAAVVLGEEFRPLLPKVAERIMPGAAPGEGVFIGIGDREFVAYREAAGGARLVPAAEVPEAVHIGRRIDLTQFGRILFEVVAEFLREKGHTQGLLVVVSAHEGRPPTFLVFDLDRKVMAVTLSPGSVDVASEQAASGKSWRMLEAAVIEGQLLAFVKNPVSFAGRAVNFGLQTVRVMLRRRSWPAPKIPPIVTDEPGMDLPAFEAKLDSMMGSRRYRGSIRLIVDGSNFFPLLERRIAEARQSLHLRVCIWDTDDFAVELADKVRQRSLKIPDTRVVIDRVTSLDASLVPPQTPMPEDFRPPRAIQPYLRDGSKVHVRNFLNSMTMGDHSKVYIVDRKYAYVGGMNAGREYRYEWHDAMAELEGPIVGWLERDFQLAWSHASILGDLAYAGAYLTQPKAYEGPAEREDYVDIRPIYTKTLNPVVLRYLRVALGRARRYAWIANPYIYDDTVIRALIEARRRGVDVRVVMPSQADMDTSDSNNKVKANRLLQNGVRVYSFPGMMHTKAAIVDGWGILGSCNFNKLSLRTNDEIDIATSDPTFVGQMRRELFEADFTRAQELTEPLPVTGSDRFAEMLAHQQ
ncbi:MAG: phospholipase D-like domain-containing protein [Acidobacteriota bacterium]